MVRGLARDAALAQDLAEDDIVRVKDEYGRGEELRRAPRSLHSEPDRGREAKVRS